MSETEPEVVWSPLPGSQALAIGCPCNHILYEGTRGPGKTDWQVMFFRRFVGMGYGAFWKGIIFDREYKNLDDLIAKSQKWFPKFNDGARFLSSKSDYKWVWPSGEELLFRQIKKESDYWNYHGHEYPFIGWNELTKFPTPDLYDMMMSCNRASFIPEENTPAEIVEQDGYLPAIPLIVAATTNPYGSGHNWVKRRFINVAKPGEIVRREIDTFNPRTQRRETVVKTQVRIFGSYKENRYLSPEYIAELESIREPNKRRAWLHGDWDIVAGGALDDLWDTDVHMVPRFAVPKEWRVERSFDWGSTHPFSVGWWAVSNGEDVTLPDGSVRTFPAGSLIRIHEWYGSQEIGENKGLKMGAKAVAEGILKREEILKRDGWIFTKPRPGPADNEIANVRNKDTDTIARTMEKHGVTWARSEKGPGSRKNGLQIIRDRLQASLDGEGPGLYFMLHCTASAELLPTLPRSEKDPDDVDTDAEDHLYDDVRYECLSHGSRAARSIKVKQAT